MTVPTRQANKINFATIEGKENRKREKENKEEKIFRGNGESGFSLIAFMANSFLHHTFFWN